MKRVLKHYESQSEDEAVAEAEAAPDSSVATVMNVPTDLVPEVRELIARHKTSAWQATVPTAQSPVRVGGQAAERHGLDLRV